MAIFLAPQQDKGRIVQGSTVVVEFFYEGVLNPTLIHPSCGCTTPINIPELNKMEARYTAPFLPDGVNEQKSYKTIKILEKNERFEDIEHNLSFLSITVR